MFYTASRTYTSRRDKGLSWNSFDGQSITTAVFLIIKQHRDSCSSGGRREEEIFSSNLYSTSSKLVTNRVPARKIILCTHTRTSHRHRQLVRVYKLRANADGTPFVVNSTCTRHRWAATSARGTHTDCGSKINHTSEVARKENNNNNEKTKREKWKNNKENAYLCSIPTYRKEKKKNFQRCEKRDDACAHRRSKQTATAAASNLRNFIVRVKYRMEYNMTCRGEVSIRMGRRRRRATAAGRGGMPTDKSQTDKTGDNRVNNKCPLAAAATAARRLRRRSIVFTARQLPRALALRRRLTDKTMRCAGAV